MDVRFLFFGLDRTGGTLVALQFIEALLQADNVVTVTTLGRPGDKRFLVPPPAVEVTYLGLRARAYKALVRVVPGELGFPLLEMRRLGRAVGSPDLVVATYSLTAAPAVESGRPVLYHAQHFEPLIVPGRRAVELARSSYRLDTYLTANSTWVANRIADAGGNVRGIVTPGIDLTTFSPRDADLPSMQPLRVITLGKAVAWKGLIDVVEGVRRFAAAHKGGVELVTYGPDAPAGTAGLNHRHVGLIAQPQLAALYHSSSVCVSGSWYESFPLPPIEAMATGIPVICTSAGTEDYAVHEKNCLIVAPKDPDAIAAALTRLAGDSGLRAELVAAGLETAAGATWQRATTEFLRHAALAAGRGADEPGAPAPPGT